MGTRATIITPVNDLDFDINVIDYDSSFKAISVSNDGYPSNMITSLQSIIKEIGINKLYDGGSARVFHKKYNPNQLGMHNSNYPQQNVSIVYNRDCGYNENNNYKVITLKNVKKDYPYSCYYYLIHNDNVYWSHADANKLKFKVYNINEDENE